MLTVVMIPVCLHFMIKALSPVTLRVWRVVVANRPRIETLSIKRGMVQHEKLKSVPVFFLCWSNPFFFLLRPSSHHNSSSQKAGMWKASCIHYRSSVVRCNFLGQAICCKCCWKCVAFMRMNMKWSDPSVRKCAATCRMRCWWCVVSQRQ